MNMQKARERARALVGQMTVEEKISQLLYNSPAIERLGIREYNWWNEASHGVARSGMATVFPHAIALASTFDPELIGTVGDAVSTEARAKYNKRVEWGDRDIYRKVPTWDDLTPGLALRAGLGLDGAALHAARLFVAEEGPDCRRLSITDEQYGALVAFLLESGVRDADGRLVPLAGTTGFGATDAFYEARGRYHPFFTCNTWSNLALKRAGLPCCVWTPFASPILRHAAP